MVAVRIRDNFGSEGDSKRRLVLNVSANSDRFPRSRTATELARPGVRGPADTTPHPGGPGMSDISSAGRNGERPVADHVLHRQVFDHDHVMVADQPGGGAVQEVGAGRADLAVGVGYLGPGLGPVRGAPLAAGKPPLVAGEICSRRASMRGLGILSPLEVTAKSLMPRSTPTTAPVAGSCTGSATSTAKETYQRPHGSLETVTVVGLIDAASTSGQDQVNASGASILARNRLSWPSGRRWPGEVRRYLLALVPGVL